MGLRDSLNSRQLPLLLLVQLSCHVHVRAWIQSPFSSVDAFTANASSFPVEGRRLLESAFPGSQAVPGGVLLPLTARHNIARGRGLMRSGVLPVEGSVNEVGYFYATVNFGTPSHQFDLIIDTGSTITYVPCSDCGSKCGKHHDPAFDPKKSSTARVLGCAPKEPLCNCGSPRCLCQSNVCYFTRSYAEGSSSQGILIEDVFSFPDTAGRVVSDSSVRLVFGCERGETGEIYRQRADGLIGMGDNDNSFQSQLVKMGAIADSFALCFGHPTGGTLLLGDVEFPGSERMVYTPLLRLPGVHYYTVSLSKVTVGGQVVNVPLSTYAKGYGCVMDSGTTFMYLPSTAFALFAALVKEAAKKSNLVSRAGPDPKIKDICWKGAPSDPKQLHTVFPEAELVFAGGTVLKLRPLQYLFQISRDSYCLGVFDNGNSGTLVGGIAVRNVVTKYDRANRRIGFLSMDSCEDARKAIASTAQQPFKAGPPPPRASPPPSPQQHAPPTHPPPSVPAQHTASPEPSPAEAPAPSPGPAATSDDSGTRGAGDGSGSGSGGENGVDSEGGGTKGDEPGKQGGDARSSLLPAWVSSAVVPVLLFLVLGVMAWAAFVYRGVLMSQAQAQYSQVGAGVETGQEMGWAPPAGPGQPARV